MFYFPYGSNMSPDRLDSRGISYSSAQKGVLNGYRLEFNKMSNNGSGSGFANIVYERKICCNLL